MSSSKDYIIGYQETKVSEYWEEIDDMDTLLIYEDGRVIADSVSPDIRWAGTANIGAAKVNSLAERLDRALANAISQSNLGERYNRIVLEHKNKRREHTWNYSFNGETTPESLKELEQELRDIYRNVKLEQTKYDETYL